ncbi:hypothetical protein TNCV_2159801 [Trichonephila clavipes]|nr:hypothetical protein TNCV_2159801 [Trichonephila clavipes]
MLFRLLITWPRYPSSHSHEVVTRVVLPWAQVLMSSNTYCVDGLMHAKSVAPQSPHIAEGRNLDEGFPTQLSFSLLAHFSKLRHPSQLVSMPVQGY